MCYICSITYVLPWDGRVALLYYFSLSLINEQGTSLNKKWGSGVETQPNQKKSEPHSKRDIQNVTWFMQYVYVM